MPPHEKGADLLQRMDNAMSYTESGVELVFNTIKDKPWFSRTLFIVMADHGLSLGTHNSSSLGWGLYSEHTWIPFLIYGAHPKLGAPRYHHIPGSQIDIAPTLLELVGISVPNHFAGHNLLRENIPASNYSFAVKKEQVLVENSRYRWHGPWGELPRQQGLEAFDAQTDRQELHNLAVDGEIDFQVDKAVLYSHVILNMFLIENNLVRPKTEY